MVILPSPSHTTLRQLTKNFAPSPLESFAQTLKQLREARDNQSEIEYNELLSSSSDALLLGQPDPSLTQNPDPSLTQNRDDSPTQHASTSSHTSSQHSQGGTKRGHGSISSC